MSAVGQVWTSNFVRVEVNGLRAFCEHFWVWRGFYLAEIGKCELSQAARRGSEEGILTDLRAGVGCRAGMDFKLGEGRGKWSASIFLAFLGLARFLSRRNREMRDF